MPWVKRIYWVRDDDRNSLDDSPTEKAWETSRQRAQPNPDSDETLGSARHEPPHVVPQTEGEA